MSKQKHNLLIVAHPDDETIFFTGALLKIKTHPWHVVCVTDGNADGLGTKRQREFAKACRLLHVKKIHYLDQPDKFEQRLDIKKIQEQLQQLPLPSKVFTHGPLGEYGHPHHQDISWAAHSLYDPLGLNVWAPAYNCLAERRITLNAKEYAIKTQILSQVYFNETKRHVHFLPALSAEGYVRFSLDEVRAIRDYLIDGTDTLNKKKLFHYRWHAPYIESFKKLKRPF